MFAAGDIRAGSMKRVAAAVGEGSSVIQSVHHYLTQFPDGQPAGDGPSLSNQEETRDDPLCPHVDRRGW